jgi:hypothetical protein
MSRVVENGAALKSLKVAFRQSDAIFAGNGSNFVVLLNRLVIFSSPAPFAALSRFFPSFFSMTPRGQTRSEVRRMIAAGLLEAG